jgi:DNA-binding transcriptional regulator YdaS (Cro superfamily)
MSVAAVTFPNAAEALRAAVDLIGSQAATGRLLGVSQQTVGKWLELGKSLPPKHVLTVEEATGISRYDLAPDIYPRPGAETADPSLFDRFGGPPAMAEALDLPLATIIRWQQDRLIPADQQPHVLRTAAQLEIAVTAEDVVFPFPADRQAA